MRAVEAGSGVLDPFQTKTYEEIKNKSLTKFQEGDVLFAKITPCMENGKIAVASGLMQGRGVGSTEFHVLRPSKNMSARYLMHYLLRSKFRVEAEKNMSGAVGQQRVPKDYLARYPIPIPPLAEQYRIVQTLEDHLSRLDVASRYVSHVQSLIPQQTHALYSAATEGSLASGSKEPVPDFPSLRRSAWSRSQPGKKYRAPIGPNLSILPVVPNGWTVASLESLTDPIRVIRYGILMPKVKSGGTVPYVEVKDLAGCTLHKKKLHLTSTELDEKFSGARIRANDVLLAVRGSYDRSAVVPESLENANVSRDVARLSPLPGLEADYLNIYLQSRFAQQYLKNHARGVAVKGVNIASVRAMPIVVPPLDLQQQIISAVKEKLTAVEVISRTITHSLRRSAGLREALLERAFSGQLAPQDPSDEPASTLLNHIRAESDDQEAKPKRANRTKKAATPNATPSPPPRPSKPIPSDAVQQELPL